MSRSVSPLSVVAHHARGSGWHRGRAARRYLEAYKLDLAMRRYPQGAAPAPAPAPAGPRAAARARAAK